MPVGRPRNDRQLAHCREEGLSCHECVSNVASSLVQIVTDLDSSTVRQLFIAMYPESSCLHMVSSFVQIVNQEKDLVVRKPVYSMPRFQVAAAAVA
jgi:hypothetical protein